MFQVILDFLSRRSQPRLLDTLWFGGGEHVCVQMHVSGYFLK